MATNLEKNFEEEEQAHIVDPSQPHMAVAMLLDTSYSMEGDSIKSLNAAVNKFISDCQQNNDICSTVDLAIITFNSTVDVLTPFTPIGEVGEVHVDASGSTHMGEAILKAIDMVKDRNITYADAGTPVRKPWIFMITDGAPTDDIGEAARRLDEERAKGETGKIIFWGIGVPGYDKATLVQLSAKKSIDDHIIELENHTDSYAALFNWTRDSLAKISVSRVTDKIKYDELHKGTRLPDWQD